MRYREEIEELSKNVKQLQSLDSPEQVTDEEAVAAINVLNFVRYKDIPDVFLGCSAYNLLNAYVKQKNNGLTCHFHRLISEILKGIEDIDKPKVIKVKFRKEENLNLLIISFWDFQFSFQSIRYNEQIKKLETKNDVLWDGIRKQKCAKTIFRFALENGHISNVTLGGDCLLDFVENEIRLYSLGGYTIKKGRFVKEQELRPAKDEQNEYLKNYVRKKLYSCQDRPVIISAIFRRIWEKHVTFTSVKPYIPNTRVITICDHINLYRPDVERVIDLSELIIGKRYYIIGYCKPYDGADRMGVQLVIDEEFCPIFGIDEYNKMPPDIMSKCHRFSIEEYLSAMQKELKL